MLNKTSQVQGPKRQYPGEAEAADIVVYLKSLTARAGLDKEKALELREFSELLLPCLALGDNKAASEVSLPIDDLEDELIGEVLATRNTTIGKKGLEFHA